MKVYIQAINTLLLFLLIAPSHISAAQQQTPTLIQAKPLSSTKSSKKEWWKNPWLYVASASLVVTAVIGTFFGIQATKTTLRKPEPQMTQPQDTIEAIVEMPSPEEEKRLAGLSALQLYKEHVYTMENASVEERAKTQFFIYAFIHDLITITYLSPKILETAQEPMDYFMRSEFPKLYTQLNAMNQEERAATLQKKFSIDPEHPNKEDAYFTWRYFSELNERLIKAIEASNNDEMKEDLAKYLKQKFIMNPKARVAPTH